MAKGSFWRADACMQLAATKQELQEAEKEFFSRNSEGTLGSFVDKFEHGFGTQLGAVLLWQRVRSGGLMIAAWSYQTTAAGNKKTKKDRFFSRN